MFQKVSVQIAHNRTPCQRDQAPGSNKPITVGADLLEDYSYVCNILKRPEALVSESKDLRQVVAGCK